MSSKTKAAKAKANDASLHDAHVVAQHEHATVTKAFTVIDALIAPVVPVVPALPVRTVKSAKQWLIELLSANDANGAPVRYTLNELITLTGKTEVNIRTMLSDLRSARYCGKYGVFNTISTRNAGVTHYQRAV